MTASEPTALPIPLPQTGVLVIARAATLLPAPLFGSTPKAAQRFVLYRANQQ